MKRFIKPSILVWLATLLVCVILIARTQFTADMSAFLPDHPSAEQQLLVDQLKGGMVSRTFLIGIEGSTPASRAQLSHQLAARLRSSGHFLVVRNGEAESNTKENQLLFENRYLLSHAVTPEHFSAAGLRESIGNSIDLLSSPAGLMVKKLLLRDPSGEMLAILGNFDGNHTIPVVDDAWTSQDGQRAILIAQTGADGSDTDAQQSNMQQIHTDFSGATHATGIDDAKLLVSGAPVFSVNTRATIQQEVKKLSIISTAAVIMLLFLIYRSVTALTLGLLPVLSGVLAGIAAVSLGFGSVHGITIGFGTTLIGEAVDYTIYYFVQSQTREHAGENWIKRFWPTIRLGVLTSVCGFASLLFSSFPGLAQIGLYSITGLLTAAAVTRFVLPHLRPAHLRMVDTTRIGVKLITLVAAITQWRALVYLLLAGASVFIFLHRDGMWSAGLSGLSPIPQAEQDLDMRLRADLGTPEMRYLVVVSSDTQERSLQSAERVANVLQGLVSQGVIASFDSPTRFLPSQATQKARQAALPDKAALQQNLVLALQGLPIKPERLSNFVEAVDAARQSPLLGYAQLQGSSLGMAVDAMLLRHGTGWSAILPLRVTTAPGTDFNPSGLKTALQNAGIDNALVIDMLKQSNQLYTDYLHEVIVYSLIGLLGIVFMLAVALKSPARLWHVLLPVVAAVVFVIGGLVLAGEKLTLFHLIGMLLIVAIGSNYSLFFDRYSLAAAVEPHTLASLLFATLTTVIAFGTLALSHVPVLHAIGATVSPGAILALILAAMFSSYGQSRPDKI